MDTEVRDRLDAVVEDDIRRGFVDVPFPEHLVQSLTELQELEPGLNLPTVASVRFVRLTPRRKRQINEAVIRNYHRDLKDSSILSRQQLRKINIERGEWSVEDETNLDELTEQTNAIMRDLYIDGFDPESEWAQEIIDRKDDVTTAVKNSGSSDEDVVRYLGILERWVNYTSFQQAEYTTKYAKEQERDEYSPDRDQQSLLSEVPNDDAADAIFAIEDYKYKLSKLIELTPLRTELVDLQIKHARIFSDSVEQRRDNNEEMARLYYCASLLDEKGVDCGSLMPTFEGLWEFPDDVIQWLLIEAHMFLQGIPSDAREFMEQWNFIPRQSGPSQLSEESPDLSDTRPDSPLPMETPSTSSEEVATS